MYNCWPSVSTAPGRGERLRQRSRRCQTPTHVSEATAPWLQMTALLSAGDTVELQGYFRAADGYFPAKHTSY